MNYFDYDDDSCADIQYSTAKDGLSVIAKRKIGRGEAVSLAAPEGTNDWLLMKKGTSCPTKPTLLPFPISLSPEDPMYQQKVSIMGGLTKRTFMLSGDINTMGFMEFISFGRFYWWNGSEEDLKQLRDDEI